MATSLQRYTSSNVSGSLNGILKERIEKERKSAVEISSRIASVLPENVIVEILSRLPVKDVLHFKSVCKLWYSIISSPQFIDKHMNNYYKNSDSCCLIAQYEVISDEIHLFELLVDETTRIVAHEKLDDVPMYGSYIYGPCDGIYLLHDKYDDEYGRRALWNPTTNEVKVLPHIITKPDLPSYLDYAGHEVYGFGFDLATKDYKVVVIKGYWDEGDEQLWPSPLSVLIYSLRTNSWRYWGDLPEDFTLQKSKSYIFLQGCSYWLGSYPDDNDYEFIISFDMGTEGFQAIDVPNYDRPASRELGIYHELVAFLTVHKDKVFDIWTWNEEEQWTKKFTMGTILEIARPVGHWKKNKFVLECDDSRLVLCNPEKQEMKDLKFRCGCRCQGVFVYKESLVSIKDKGPGGEK